MRLTLTIPAATVVAADTEARRLAGIAVPYGQLGQTSAGPLTIDAGAIRIPENLRAVKLFREHDRTRPIGYAVEATDSDDALRMAFTIGRTPDGDTALLEAAEGLRDALSVELDNVTETKGHVTAADLLAVAQVALPAFAAARLAAALTDDTQAEVHGLASQIVDLTAPEETEETEETTETPTTEEDTMTETASAAMAPAPVTAAMAPAATAGPRPPSFEAACAALAAAHASGRSLTAALTDIVPANDVGMGALGPQWINEVWTPVATRRYFIEAINRQALTSGLKVYGWQWDVYPVVGPYTGDKTAVPSSPASTQAVEAPVERLAGGWDLDRIYVDLGAAGFIEAFFQAAVRDLAAKQDADVGTTLSNGASVDGTAADVWAMIAAAASALATRGASMSFCGLASDLWAAYISTATATVPWWVPNGAAPSLNSQTGTAADVPFFMAPSLAAGTLLAGDRNAATFYEPSPNPVRVNAVNIPNGGVDLGVFGYHAVLINDARGLSKVTKTP
jgi:hypothetical protein